MSALPQAQAPRRPSASAAGPRRRRAADPAHSARARGEGMLWLCGGALLICVVMVLGLLGLVAYQGAATFWPQPVLEIEQLDGSKVVGEVTRTDTYTPGPEALAALPPQQAEAMRQRLQQSDGRATRQLVRTGNFELTQRHFQCVDDFAVAAVQRPPWALVVERRSWGRDYGEPVALLEDGKPVATGAAATWAAFGQRHPAALARLQQREHIAAVDIAALSQREWNARLATRRAQLDVDAAKAVLHRVSASAPPPRDGDAADAAVAAASQALAAATAARQAAAADESRVQAECAGRRQQFDAELHAIDAANAREALRIRISDGRTEDLALADVVRAYPANQLGWVDRLGVYLSRWGEFLLDDPRGSGSEGGVYPAIVGTVLMTLLMSICVVPFGILAALYLREYAKGGFIVSAVRIAVNNLAGVPSIVFGVFGLGFFCYIIGGSIDQLFYPELLPSPTFGKGALVWASLTLALLTLPVVIVATEEALAAVPRSMREGSYACGASKWQTIRRIVLPRAMPGVMTGAILAMARGAGEVAPLMLVGAAKFAPESPLDATAPYLHPSRSFMHLGFQIYDLGFQSQNSEAAKPVVFTTTLLLIAIITLLNLAAIWLRSRLRRRFVGAQF